MFRYLRNLYLLATLAGTMLLTSAEGGTGAGGTGSGSGGTGSGGEGAGGAGTGTGGAGGQGGAGGTAGGSGSGGTSGGAGGAQGGAQGGAAGTGGQPQDVASLPEWAQRTIREARAEAATNRVGRTTAETARADALKALAATLGVDVTTGAPTAEQLQGTVQTLTGERDTLQASNRLLTVQAAAVPAAVKAGADVVALLDSASFLAKLGQLDPAAADFAAQLDGAIKAALDGNSKLKAGQAPARGGFDPTGGTGGDTPPASLEEAINRRLAAQS